MNARTTTLILALAGSLAGCPGGDPDCGTMFVRDPATGECVCPGGGAFVGGMCQAGDAGVDGAVADAGDAGDVPDAGPDAGPGPVNVIVEREGTRRAGLSVIFHDASGVVLEMLETDADGEVTSTMPGVGMVTVVVEDTEATRLSTVQGVRSLDTIRFELEASLETARELSVSLPGPHPGASGYRIYSYCFSGESFSDPSTVSFGCDIAGRTRVLALAESTPPAWSFRYTNDDAVNVVLSAWRTETTTMPVSLASVGFADAALAAGIADLDWPTPALAVAEGSADAMEIPSLPFELIVSASGTRASVPSMTSIVSRLYAAGELSGFEDDLSTTPAITELVTTRDDPSRPGIEWTGTGVRSGVELAMGYTPDARPVYWTITSPPESSSISLPALPDDLASLRPSTETPFYEVRFLDGGAELGWDALRARPYRPWIERTRRFAETRASGDF